MKLEILTPAKSLNKAYFKQSLKIEQIELFKSELAKTFAHIDEKQDEEYHKNVISKLLHEVYYKDKYLVNVNKKQDLVVRNGNKTDDAIAIILEFKKPTEKKDMVSKDNANVKALQELVLYYLRETIGNNNHEIKYLIATNIYDWFVFDGVWFEKNIFNNTALQKDYKNWDVTKHGTDHFYKFIAAKYLDLIEEEVPCTYFNLKDVKKILDKTELNEKEEETIINLYKILSPEHLLKLPFANDSNTLNKEFYNELLHIIGLEETKETGKKLIKRAKEEHRNEGSLIEETLKLVKQKITNREAASEDQTTETSTEENEYEIALELCIIWINRILFLKLLEAQLIKFNGDASYAFLNINKVIDFDDLNDLFLDAFANPKEKRRKDVQVKFGNLPYLNSSLFEENELEIKYAFISNLKKRLKMPVYEHTVLKEANGNKITGKKNTLQYLFEFLEAYNFESVTTAKIQTQNKTIINASVLGLIFEKLNGYKDGSFYTPGFITMYMCRETIRKAIAQKFSTLENKEIESFEDVKSYCARYFKKEDIARFNSHINSLKICDPAVGSGHFLVSALNEIIAIKSELNILADAKGVPIEYEVTVDNDELTIVNKKTNKPFEYKLGDDKKPPKNLQQIQLTLFVEKQKIIEDCLFGVDINPKSVMICRLRLWIELLKNMYYTQSSDYQDLETLPNIDINIKCGNSLINRFDIKDSYTKLPAATQQKIKLATQKYKDQVIIYKSTTDKATKKLTEKNIAALKQTFSQIANPTDADYKKWKEAEAKLGEMPLLFSKEDQEAWKLKLEHITGEAKLLQNKYKYKLKTIYDKAFEWRFEFPEVLNEDGDFVGFDVVIGNPPYIRQEEFSDIKPFLKQRFKIFNSIADLLTYFVELGFELLKEKGNFQFIISNKFTRASYGKEMRNFLLKNTQLSHFIDFSGLPVFDEATVDAAILGFCKQKNNQSNLEYANVEKKEFEINNFEGYLNNIKQTFPQAMLTENTWAFEKPQVLQIKRKVEAQGVPLKDWDITINYGIKTGYNEAFVIDGKKKDELIAQDPKSAEYIKRLLRGRDIEKWQADFKDLWLIYIPKGFTIKSKIEPKNNVVEEPKPRYGYVEYDEAWEWFKQQLPAIAAHLLPFKSKAEKRTDMGDYWWELRACAYIDDFEKPKIIYKDIAQKLTFLIDNKNYYTNNTNYFIIGNANLEFLAGILNSSLINFYYKLISTQLGENAVRLFTQFVEKIPIIKYDNSNNQKNIIKNVSKIIELKEQNFNADTTKLEKQIDELVYALYGLTEEEIRIVEGGK